MEIILELLNLVPKGLPRILFLLFGLAAYFSPAIINKFVRGQVAKDELEEVKTLLEIKFLALQIAEKEGKTTSDLKSIVKAKNLQKELFGKEAVEETQKLSWAQKLKHTLVGSMSVTIVLIIINLINKEKNLDINHASILLLRDIAVGLSAGVLSAFYPSNKTKVLYIAGAFMPFIITLILLIFKLV